MKSDRLAFLVVPAFFFLCGTWLYAEEEFQCEVLGFQGTVTVTDVEGNARDLEQGDLLRVGDELEVGENSYADLAYDRDWQNITRLESNSKIRISSIVPGKLGLEEGGVFARLKKLPQESSFEVRTPTAVATVRGSEYRTMFSKGQTEVFNAASSQVLVYGVDSDGKVDKDSGVILEQDNKTSVAGAGELPAAPAAMSEEEKSVGESLKGGIETNVKEAESQGRSANIQTVEQIERYIVEEKKKAQRLLSPNESELSRVTDTRRRAFGGGEKALAPPPEEELEQKFQEQATEAKEPEPPSA